jgi:hypothetical protein
MLHEKHDSGQQNDESGDVSRRDFIAMSIASGIVATATTIGGSSLQAQSPSSPPGQSPDAWATDMASHPLSPNEKGGMEVSGPYEVVPDHFKPPFPPGWTWAAVPGIYAESPDRIYIYTRGMIPKRDTYMRFDGTPLQNATDANRPVTDLGKELVREHILTAYDRNGNLLEDWKELDALHPAGSSAHRIRIDPNDPERHLWLIDEGLPEPSEFAPGAEVKLGQLKVGQILKMTRDGKLVMRIGPDKVGHPQDLAFLANGDFWVIEGFTVNHIAKFSKEGERLMEFSRGGSAPGEINSPHGIAIDKRGRLIVGEQGGHRIQVFDQAGESLDIWPNIPFGAGTLSIDTNDRVWASDAILHRIAAFDLEGRLQSYWGSAGLYPGQLYGVSQFSTDSEGNLYTAEHYGGRAQMFRPKKGTDPKRLVGRLPQN